MDDSWLIDKFHMFTWMVGAYDDGYNGGISHAWLATEDKDIVIDITGDQFKNNSQLDKVFTAPVYVGPFSDGFHDCFQHYAYTEYQMSTDLFTNSRDIDKEKQYTAIVSHII